MTRKFRPTHEITLTDTRDGTRSTTDVQLVDGAGYTREEWDTEASADWEWSAETGWTFQGQAAPANHLSVSVRAKKRNVPTGSEYATPRR
jgi:hypothetical protein